MVTWGFSHAEMKLCHFGRVYIVVYYMREITTYHGVYSGENPAVPT